MDKEKLIKLAEDLYQSAFDANAYYAIMMQYREMSKKYKCETKINQNVQKKTNLKTSLNNLEKIE